MLLLQRVNEDETILTLNNCPYHNTLRCGGMHSALVILSRTWAGLLLLVSSDNGLPAITCQLGASTSPSDMDAQDGILDVFRAMLSLFSSVTCKRETDRVRVLQVRT